MSKKIDDLIKVIESEISKGKAPIIDINCLQTSSGSTTNKYSVSYKYGKAEATESLQLDYDDEDSVEGIAMANLRYYLRNYKVKEESNKRVEISNLLNMEGIYSLLPKPGVQSIRRTQDRQNKQSPRRQYIPIKFYEEEVKENNYTPDHLGTKINIFA